MSGTILKGETVLPVLVFGLVYLFIANLLAYLGTITSPVLIGSVLVLLAFVALVWAGRQLGKHG